MIDRIASKTFSSQFMNPNNSQVIDVYQRFIIAIKNDRCDILSSIANSKEQLHKKDEGQKNLLYYAAYNKSQLCLLYLLRAGLSYKQLDKENKNIYHFIAYCGSLQCLQTLNFYIKLTQLIKLSENILKLVNKYGYKRTDMKAGKLKYSVSAKKQAQFEQLKKQAQEMYIKYLNNYMADIYQCLKVQDQDNQRNPFHLVCLNKYQKCYPTLQQLINEILNPHLSLNNKLLTNMGTTNTFYQQQIDPRLYQDSLNSLTQMISIQTKNAINKNYERQAKSKIKSLLQVKDKDGYSALGIASKNGSTAMINLLQKYIPNPKIQQKQQIMKVANHNLARSHILDLCQASQLSDVKPMNFLISCGEQVNQKKTIFGVFPLLEALKSYEKQRSLQPLKTLIKSGADVNTQDTNGWTVLHHAASLGLKDVVTELVDNSEHSKLDVNKVTNKRYHALHIAAMENHAQIIVLLLESDKVKVNINVADWDGCTPLMHAARKGSLDVLKALLSRNADVYAKDVRDMTALHHAAFTFHPQCIRELLNYDSDNDKLRAMRNTKGKLAKDLCTDTKPFQNIFTSARTGNVNLIRKQIAENPTFKDATTLQKQRTPLILAVLAKSLPSVKFLVDSGADTYHQDKTGKSAGTYCEELLAEAKKNKNQQDIKTLQQIKRILQ